jgi:hypothetical protein
MKTRTLFFATATLAFAATALAGGLPTAAAAKPKPVAKSATGLTTASAAKCEGNGTVCTLAVTAPECAVTVKPEYLIVTGKNVKLRWVIQTKGYTFPETKGIFFKEKYSAGYASEFDNCRRVNATTWECTDKNAKPPMFFKYGVNVLKPDNSACKTLDPTIFNDMGEIVEP